MYRSLNKVIDDRAGIAERSGLDGEEYDGDCNHHQNDCDESQEGGASVPQTLVAPAALIGVAGRTIDLEAVLLQALTFVGPALSVGFQMGGWSVRG
jgi:hypothetical protein